MGSYKYVKESFEKSYHERSPIYRQRITEWRKLGTVVRIEKPTNIPRARTLGYKAKKGYVMVRVAVGKGQRKRRKPMGGRKPAKNVRYLSPRKSYQRMAEEKAARKFRNLEVMNSYWAAEDGTKKFYEIIMLDRSMFEGVPRGRAFRGLTSSAKKGRQ